MAAPYITFVESNIKGGVRAALGLRTLVAGPNGTGKSAVLNTLELALTGAVSDIVGRREVKKEVELQALAPGRKGELLARAAFSDGQEAVWRAGGKSKKAKHTYPESILDPATALPLRPVYEAILGNVDTARKFFMQFAVGAVTDADVLKRIPESLHPYYRRATVAGTLSTSSPTDRLLAALEHARKQTRAAAATAKTAESVVNQSTQGLTPLPTEAQEKALRDAEKDAQARLDALKGALTKREAVEVAERERADLEAKVQQAEVVYLAAKGERERAEQALAAMAVPRGADDTVLALKRVITAHRETHKSECLCCGTSFNMVVAPWDERIAMLDQYLAQQQAETDAYVAAKTAVATAMVKEQQAFTEGTAIYERLQTMRALLQTAGAEAVPTPDAIAQAEAAVSAAREALRQVDMLKASWATASKARDSVNEAQQDAGEWKKLAEACAEAVTALLDGGVASFVARVQTGLPPADHYALTLRDGDRGVFQFGFMKSNVLYTALSGAEWARATAAMAAACRVSPNKVAVVIPQPGEFDSVTLSAVLEAFGHLDTQVVMASAVYPQTMPAGWTLIDTAREQHRSGTQPVFDAPSVPVQPVGVGS